jgi:hypothetical protein
MGLLDSFSDPGTVGLLSAASGLLSASGPSRMPVSFGQALGAGMASGLQGMQEAKQQQDKDQMQKLQMAMMMQKVNREQNLQDMIANRLGLGASPSGQGQGSQGDAGALPPQGGLLSSPPGGGMGQGGAPVAQPMQGGVQPRLRAGGVFPFSANDIAALSVMGAPGAKDLFDIYKYSNDGIKREAGNYYVNPMTGQTTYMPKIPEGATITQDGRIIGMPGAAQTNAQYQGAQTAAQEAAKAGLDFVTVPMPDGSSRTMRRDQAAGLMGKGNVPGFGMSQSPADKTYQDENAKAIAAQYQAIQSAGMKAPGAIAKYQQLDSLLANHDGGKLSPLGVDIAKYANSLGFKIDKNLPNKEAARALSNELALQLRDPSSGAGMPGSLSDSERQYLVDSVPNLSQSAQGRHQMVQMAIALQQRNSDVAQMARKWQQRYGRLDAINPNTGKSFFDNLQDWSSANPLFPQQQPQQP